MSLKSNPFLWSSVEKLCSMRSPPHFSKVFVWPKDSFTRDKSKCIDTLACHESSMQLVHTPQVLPNISKIVKSTPLTSSRRKTRPMGSKVFFKSRIILFNKD
ncbi:hypothetical protein RF11_04217 [Thelohanellus kitauei]|uniref:Uncharacterized protein n=1 Tax=Thelohanellus kitauei TaxID=669202 RepID=A0A0C2N5E8_THEKT|nr:hypothetical protein RF11_04217 [Thelohanellus kitauei]